MMNMITCRQGKPMVTSEALQEGPPRMCITQVQLVHCQYFAMYHTMDTILCTYAGATCTILVRVMLYFAIPNYTAQGVHAGATCSMPILCIVPMDMDTLLCTQAVCDILQFCGLVCSEPYLCARTQDVM